jgi:ElaB/YqjD/DUF883 family membrane-anchored ribosome-binding protein
MIDTTTAKEQLAADFRTVMTDIEALMSAGANFTGAEGAALRARIQERLDVAKRRAIELQHEAAEQARRAAHATDSFVHEHPWQAIGVAAALGAVLGMLIARR